MHKEQHSTCSKYRQNPYHRGCSSPSLFNSLNTHSIAPRSPNSHLPNLVFKKTFNELIHNHLSVPNNFGD